MISAAEGAPISRVPGLASLASLAHEPWLIEAPEIRRYSD
jgi:hypothetical protein